MDSQAHKVKDITEEEFRSCYPDVSISHKATPRGTPGVDKRTPVKAQIVAKPAIMPKSSPGPKTPIGPKSVMSSRTVQNSGAKPAPASKMNVSAVTKSPAVPAKGSPVGKIVAVTKTPIMIKPHIPAKTPAVKTPLVTPTPLQVVKASVPGTKASTPVKASPVLKTTQVKTPIGKVPQPVMKQTTLNVTKQVVKTPAKPVAAATPAKNEDSPDQSTMTVLTYHLPQTTPQRSVNQLTIEKVEQQQRIPVVLDSNNQVVLQQVINNNGQLVLNRVAPMEASSVQSVVIGTTALAPPVMPPQVEITTSDTMQTLQVTQQVTLIRPKGPNQSFNVDNVKKQFTSNKQNAMTNVVSSTTPAPVPALTHSVHHEQKRLLPNGRPELLPQSPLRQSNRVNPLHRPPGKAMNVRQPFQSTQGRVKKVSPKRDIPMQKVSPMQPPPLPGPDLLFGNDEVSTSEAIPQAAASALDADAKVIVILPNGETKSLSITDDLSCTLSDMIKMSMLKNNVPGDLQAITAEIQSGDAEEFQDMETSEAQWNDSAEREDPEPGEILGFQDDGDVDAGDLERQSHEQTVQSEADESLKDSIVLSRKTKPDSLTEESPKKKRVCRRRKLEEPVCLTISDDEELLGLAHHHHHRHHHHMQEESFHSDSNSQMSSCDKEPIITDEMVSEVKLSSVSGGGLDMEELLDNPDPKDKTFLQCRTVRIGSYKVVPKDKVLITPHGLKVTVPVLNSDQYVELKIMHYEMIKVLIHFGRQMPVLFFYTRPSAAAKIRKALKLEDKNGFYYDTTSSDETHRRITFLPDKIDDDCKNTLKTIFGNPENQVFAELTGKEANDILVKASPKEVQAFILKKQPNNNQQPQPQPPQPFNGQNIQTIMVYPPPPEKGGIPINTEDYACLGEDQFLNDVIIDFYLKYVVEKTLSPEDRGRTHVFSSFFYKRLTTKPPAKRKCMNPVESDPAASPAVKRHSRVKSWTKNVDLFTKDFIVIPINENSHWFLAIICFPGLTGPVRFSDNSPIDLPGRKRKKVDDKKAAVGVLSGKHMVTIGSTTITAVAPTHNAGTALDVADDGEDRDEADGEDEDMDVPDTEDDLANKAIVAEVKEEPDVEQPVRKKQREPIKQPCILIFDSLAGASRSRVVATLRDYLRVEYEVKHGEGRDFSGDVMKGTNLRCPQQTNYTDCGLYVLQYVEAFFQWPVTDYHIPIKQLQDWFQADIVSRKRYEIQQLLHRLMQEQGIDLETLSLPLLNLRPEGKLVEYSGTEEEEEEEDQMCEDEEDEEDDMLDDDGEYHENMSHDNDEMEEGEIIHQEDDEDDPDNFMDSSGMDHEDPDMDEDEYGMEEEEEDDMNEDDMQDKELEDISLAALSPVKSKDLKNFRIQRLVTKKDHN